MAAPPVAAPPVLPPSRPPKVLTTPPVFARPPLVLDPPPLLAGRAPPVEDPPAAGAPPVGSGPRGFCDALVPSLSPHAATRAAKASTDLTRVPITRWFAAWSDVSSHRYIGRRHGTSRPHLRSHLRRRC